jgi:hypothetical protein
MCSHLVGGEGTRLYDYVSGRTSSNFLTSTPECFCPNLRNGQRQVHVKGLVDGITRELPPPDIIKFLVTDGNYFPEGYFFPVSHWQLRQCFCAR